MATTVWLGNHNAVQTVDGQRQPLDGERVTIVHPPAGLTTAELIHDLTHDRGIWAAHSDADAPAWVASTDPDLATVISGLFGCPIRDAAEVEEQPC
jgi:hypothetical protein